jgi:hypothetical protein
MGLRGPKPTPPEIKALKGNPGKRRLALDAARGVAPHPHLVAEPPSYLEKAERDAFTMALASLPANVARASDVNAVARWACWLNIWVQAKRKLARNKAKPDRFDHKRMSDAEQHLTRLEDRLGLNIAARNSIVQRLIQLPGVPVVIEAEPVPEPDDESPLGFLQRKGAQFD